MSARDVAKCGSAFLFLMARVPADASPPASILLVCETKMEHNTAGPLEKNTRFVDIDLADLTVTIDRLPEFQRRHVDISPYKISANFDHNSYKVSIDLDRVTGSYQTAITGDSKRVVERGNCVLTDNRKF